MAFLVASASSSLTSGFPIDVSVFCYYSVCISSSAMIDNVVYERSVSECVNIGYLQQQKIEKKIPTLLGSLPTPI